jgi:hypothetical protein
MMLSRRSNKLKRSKWNRYSSAWRLDRPVFGQDRTIEPNKMHQAFHEAKYPVYLQMYQDQQQYQVLMNSWLTLND